LLAPEVAVLDFQGVTEVDSAAVALALECLREARRREQALSLANLPESMRTLAELYDVSELLQGQPA
jgi:ABC-type transporter Mla MlaB component